MDKPSVYIETSIVSYLAADPSRHPVTLRNQQLTHAWWNTRAGDYRLFTSELVQREAARGDPRMAQERLALLAGLHLLEVTPAAIALAGALIRDVKLPRQAETDALHIAAAATEGVAYLLTWNCTHIANPALAPRLERSSRIRGYPLPILCTPDDLMRGK